MKDLKHFLDARENDFERGCRQFLERPKSEINKNYD